MSTEGAALSHLRDVYYILTHDLSDVDLDTLATRILANPLDANTAGEIAPVVSKLASTMLLYNSSVEAADQLSKTGIRGSLIMTVLVWIILCLICIAVLSGLAYIGWNQLKVKTEPVLVLVPLIGKVFLAGMVSMTFMITWLFLLQAKRKALVHNQDVLKVGFWKIHNLVGSAFAMRFEAAVQQGTLAAFVDNQSSYHNQGSTISPGKDCEDDKDEGDPTPDCTRIIDPCGTTVQSLVSILLAACPNEVNNMLTTLQVIKAEGIDGYDRTALWKSISSGIEAIRRTISISADADTADISIPERVPNGAATTVTTLFPTIPTTATTLVSTTILAMLQTAPVKTLATARTPNPTQMKLYMAAMVVNIVATIQPLTYSLDIGNYRSVLDASMSNYYGTAYPSIRSQLMSVLTQVQQTIDVTPATPAALLVTSSILPVMQSSNVLALSSVVTADKDQLMKNTAKMTLYIDAMMGKILKVVQALPYKMNINDYRQTIDTSMSTYYGTSYPSLRFELLAVLTQVQRAVEARPPAAIQMYVDAPTMAARVQAMGAPAWSDIVLGADTTRAAVRSFLSRFKLPVHQPDLGLRISTMVSVIMTLAGFVLLMMYITDILGQLYTSSIDKQVAARYIVVAACVYALATVTVGAMIGRIKIKSTHNWESLNRNGQILAYSLDTTEASAVKIEGESQITSTDTQAYIDAATATLQAYDACNSITDGASSMPFPMMDLVVYLFIIVIVMACASMGINNLNPGEKIASIRTLMRLLERVKNGEVPGGLVKQVECCTPNEDVWNTLMWMSIVVLFGLNIYVMSSVNSTNSTYGKSLLMMVDCV